MRILNRKQLSQIPSADQGNLYLGELAENLEAKRARIQRENAARKRAEMERAHRARAMVARESMKREVAASRHAAMLERSLRRSGLKEVMAGQRQGLGFVPQYGVRNPLLGFVNETTEPDYLQQQVIPAQEFNNHLTAKNNERYLKNKDYPLVMDARSDFGGFLVNEEGSADFSSRIVDDVKSDFGAVPRPRRRR